MPTKELVSCLCITSNSPAVISKSIACYRSQTYVDKEMIIVYQSSVSEDTVHFLRSIKDTDIQTYEITSTNRLTLGELRNISIEKSKGEYLCIWDDDDWYHDQRIELQVKALQKTYKSVCLLTNLLIFDSLSGIAYYSFARLWEGSMLFKRDIFDQGLQYYALDKGEDTALLARLLSRKMIYPLVEPNIYLYIYHGKNISGYEHFKKIMRQSQQLSESAGKLIKEIAENRLSNREASDLLLRPAFLSEIDYLHSKDVVS